MKFTKMQGAGNDFIVLDNRSGEISECDYPSLAAELCRRRISIGADGLMIEVHNNPECALCDGAQSLKPEKYDALLKQVSQIATVVGKSL